MEVDHDLNPHEILEKTATTDIIYKIIVLGDGFVGKTAITIRFCEGQFQDDYKMTIGVNFGTKKFWYKNNTYTLQIWDIAGQERFRAFRSNYYSAALGAILVYDVTNKLTFLDLPHWVVECQSILGRIPILIAANKLDLVNSGLTDPRTGNPYTMEVSFKECEKFADRVKASFLETSAKGNLNIDNLFTHIIDGIEEGKWSDPLPIEPYQSIELGFAKVVRFLHLGDTERIYDSLIWLKQSIFQDNPYSVVLGNISEWINYLPKANLTNQVKTDLLKSINAWKHYYKQSLQDGQPVVSTT